MSVYLECLEGPSEEDFTGKYKVLHTHSFRPSPLAIVLVEQIIKEKIFLCLIGNNLPFHNPTTIESYESSLMEIYESLGTDHLEREVIDLIPEAKLGKIVSTYLLTMYDKEQPPENLLNHVPEIGATETKLLELVKALRAFAEVQMPLPQRKEQATQLTLFVTESPDVQKNLADKTHIPASIDKTRVNRSEQAPLIFWALVALKKSGHNLATGTEITEVINEYLVDDHHKKAPNNISRSLRSENLQSQPWLLTKHVSPRKKLFGLKENWEIYWLEIFGEPAPEVIQ